MKIQIQKTILSVLALGFFSFSAGAFAQSAVIDWGAGQQDITGDSDVFTGGTLVDAFALGGAGVTPVTVNGVTFQPFAFPISMTTNTVTQGNYNFTESAGGNQLVSYNNLGSTAVGSSFLGLGASYQTLLSNAGGSSYVDTMTLTITGLTVGQEYVFQFFTNNSSNSTSPSSGTFLSTTATGGSSIALTDNTTRVDGGLGQFAIGTFTATDPTQTIDFNGGAGFQVPTINAFQISAVPEPSSVVMMVIGVAGLGLMLRFRHSRVA